LPLTEADIDEVTFSARNGQSALALYTGFPSRPRPNPAVLWPECRGREQPHIDDATIQAVASAELVEPLAHVAETATEATAYDLWL
jgi:hypothetical protein